MTRPATLAATASPLLARAAAPGAPPSGPPAPAPPTTKPGATAPATPMIAADGAEQAAGAYTALARTWTPPTYQITWWGELTRRAGRYHRPLLVVRPPSQQGAALRADQATSRTTGVSATRLRDQRVGRARMIVVLDERTRAAAQLLTAREPTQVNLQPRDHARRVTGFTAIPRSAGQ